MDWALVRLCVLGCFAPDTFNVWGFVCDAQFANECDVETGAASSTRSSQEGLFAELFSDDKGTLNTRLTTLAEDLARRELFL